MAGQSTDHRLAFLLIAPSEMSASAAASQRSSASPVNGSVVSGVAAPSSDGLAVAGVMRGVERVLLAPRTDGAVAGAATVPGVADAEIAGAEAGAAVALESVRVDPLAGVGLEPGGVVPGLVPFPPPIWTVPVELVDVLLPPGVVPTGPPTVVPPEPAVGVTCAPDDWMAPVELVAVLPPPTCPTPDEPDAVLPLVLGPVGELTPADWFAAVPEAVGAALGDDDWATPVESVDVLPPPTCAAPVEFDAVLPLVLGPVGELTLAVWFAAVAEAVGAALGDDDCTAPVELEASLPPPACTAPVELEAVLEPPEMPAGAASVAVWLPVVALAAGLTDCGEDWTTPVEPEASLAPPDCAVPVELEASLPPPAVETGAVASAVAVLPSVFAVGAAETAPTWATPVELVAVLPGSAAAVPIGPIAAVARTTAAARRMRFIG
jgi:hypothetical protein